ncbi:MAG: hypothetical protein RLZZ347_413 [Candidatus Parcubacteria bacterium]|jgi:hypothetical protein
MKSKIAISLIVLVIIGGLLWAYKVNRGVSLGVTTSATSTVEGVVTQNNAPVVVTSGTQTTTSLLPTIPTPNFSKPLVFPANFTDAQKKDMQTHVDGYIAELKKDKLDFNAWIDLGLYWKNVQDFQGAIDAWTYASAIQPTNALPVINIASLYGYDIHDNAKAEKYYLKAISIEPKLEYAYFVTAMYYQEVENNIPKAIVIVEKGIKAIPDSLELRSFKSSLKDSLPKTPTATTTTQ